MELHPEHLFYSTSVISGIKIEIFATPDGISNIWLNKNDSTAEQIATKLHEDDPYLFGVFNQLEEYFNRERKTFDVPLNVEGTDFQKKVWNELQKIPYGKTISYKTLAERVGSVKTIRAVGGANGANPVPLIIPCHRVIHADGSLGGYSAGIAIKQKLLQLEGCLYPDLFE